MSTIYIGIDPAATGAVAIMRPESVIVFDLPTIKVKVGKTMRSRLNIAALHDELMRQVGLSANCFVTLEQLQVQPTFGASTMFWFGHSLGSLEAVLTCMQLPYQLVRPQLWKKEFAIVKDDRSKTNARQLAIRMFPKLSTDLARVRDDGRAEAALLAEYGRRTHSAKKGLELPCDLFQSTSQV